LRQGQVQFKREISNQLFVRQSPYGVKPKLISSLHGVASVKYATSKHTVFEAVPRPLCGSSGPLTLLPSKRCGSSVELQPIPTVLQQQRPHLRWCDFVGNRKSLHLERVSRRCDFALRDQFLAVFPIHLYATFSPFFVETGPIEKFPAGRKSPRLHKSALAPKWDAAPSSHYAAFTAGLRARP
jgi:hypothetical protein